MFNLNNYRKAGYAESADIHKCAQMYDLQEQLLAQGLKEILPINLPLRLILGTFSLYIMICGWCIVGGFILVMSYQISHSLYEVFVLPAWIVLFVFASYKSLRWLHRYFCFGNFRQHQSEAALYAYEHLSKVAHIAENRVPPIQYTFSFGIAKITLGITLVLSGFGFVRLIWKVLTGHGIHFSYLVGLDLFGDIAETATDSLDMVPENIPVSEHIDSIITNLSSEPSCSDVIQDSLQPNILIKDFDVLDSSGRAIIHFDSNSGIAYDGNGKEIAHMVKDSLIDSHGQVIARYDTSTGLVYDELNQPMNIKTDSGTFQHVKDVHGEGVEVINNEVFDAKTHQRVGNIEQPTNKA